jgi:hypothetical protein
LLELGSRGPRGPSCAPTPSLSACLRSRIRSEPRTSRFAWFFIEREAGWAATGIFTKEDRLPAVTPAVRNFRCALMLCCALSSAGVISYLEVLDAQRQLFAAQLDLNASEVNQRLAAVQLYKALGGDWRVANEARS